MELTTSETASIPSKPTTLREYSFSGNYLRANIWRKPLKQCPKCNRAYTDDMLAFCLDDGSALVVGYDPPATIRIPAGRATDAPQSPASPAQPYPIQQRNNRWPIYVLLTLILLVVLGGVVTLLIFGYSRMYAPASANTNEGSETQSAVPPTRPTPTPTPTPIPTAKSLVGTWRTDVVENGQRTEITVTFRADGETNYVFKDARGKTSTDSGTWQYSDETIFERFSNGASGRGSIKWIDQDNIELTIIDNGVPAFTGLKRRYRRIN
jgi:hypothetical protein